MNGARAVYGAGRGLRAAAVVAALLAGSGVNAAPAPAGDGPGLVAGDIARGRALVANVRKSQCLLCHTAPIAEVRLQGDLAPPLTGIGARSSVAELRERVTDARRTNPASIMPVYGPATGRQRVGAAWKDQPILGAQDIEDVVAWLASLK